MESINTTQNTEQQPAAIDERETQLKARESRLDCRDFLEGLTKDGKAASGITGLIDVLDSTDAEKFKKTVSALLELGAFNPQLEPLKASQALDDAAVLKVPSVRLPVNFGFMLAHPVATVAPTKLEDFRIHQDPPGISGSLVEGRICYDAFVLDNKVKAIYYQALPAAASKTASKG